MPQPTDRNKHALGKLLALVGCALLVTACGGGGSTSSGATAQPSTTPAFTPPTVSETPPTVSETPPTVSETPPTDPETPPSVVTLPQLVGYAGCSVTENAVDGYHQLGGSVLWSPDNGYPGGSISAWALELSTLSTYWQAFDSALTANPGTDAIWLQLCTSITSASQNTFENAQVVISEINRRTGGVPIFVSAQHSYSDGICSTAGADGPAQMQAVADQLVAAKLAQAGPVVGPLSISQTTDGCHANGDGKRLLGAQLQAFFTGGP